MLSRIRWLSTLSSSTFRSFLDEVDQISLLPLTQLNLDNSSDFNPRSQYTPTQDVFVLLFVSEYHVLYSSLLVWGLLRSTFRRSPEWENLRALFFPYKSDTQLSNRYYQPSNTKRPPYSVCILHYHPIKDFSFIELSKVQNGEQET